MTGRERVVALGRELEKLTGIDHVTPVELAKVPVPDPTDKRDTAWVLVLPEEEAARVVSLLEVLRDLRAGVR